MKYIIFTIIILFLVAFIVAVLMRLIKRTRRTRIWNDAEFQYLSEWTFEDMLDWVRRKVEVNTNTESDCDLALVILPNEKTIELLKDSKLSVSERKNAYYVVIRNESNTQVICGKIVVTKNLPQEMIEAFAKDNLYKIHIE